MLPDLRWSFIAGAVAVLAVILHHKKLDQGNRPWYRTVPGVALLIFVTWFWIQNLWALYPGAHFDASVQLTKYVVAFYLVYRLATGPAAIHRHPSVPRSGLRIPRRALLLRGPELWRAAGWRRGARHR